MTSFFIVLGWGNRIDIPFASHQAAITFARAKVAPPWGIQALVRT